MKQQIVDDPNGWYSVLGATPEQRQRELSEGGLDIVTTLDPDVAEGRAEGRERPVGQHAPEPGLLARTGRRDRVARHAHRGDPHDAQRPRLPEGPDQHGHDPAPAGVLVQALRARGRLRGGHPADGDLLRRPGADPRVPQRRRHPLERDQRRGHQSRIAQPVRRHGGFGQRRLRPPDRRRGARQRRRHGASRRHHDVPAALLLARDRVRRRSRRSTTPPATRRSRTAGSTASPTRSPASAGATTCSTSRFPTATASSAPTSRTS